MGNTINLKKTKKRLKARAVVSQTALDSCQWVGEAISKIAELENLQQHLLAYQTQDVNRYKSFTETVDNFSQGTGKRAITLSHQIKHLTNPDDKNAAMAELAILLPNVHDTVTELSQFLAFSKHRVDEMAATNNHDTFEVANNE